VLRFNLTSNTIRVCVDVSSNGFGFEDHLLERPVQHNLDLGSVAQAVQSRLIRYEVRRQVLAIDVLEMLESVASISAQRIQFVTFGIFEQQLLEGFILGTCRQSTNGELALTKVLRSQCAMHTSKYRTKYDTPNQVDPLAPCIMQIHSQRVGGGSTG
jgi:hypothetical protein